MYVHTYVYVYIYIYIYIILYVYTSIWSCMGRETQMGMDQDLKTRPSPMVQISLCPWEAWEAMTRRKPWPGPKRPEPLNAMPPYSKQRLGCIGSGSNQVFIVGKSSPFLAQLFG